MRLECTRLDGGLESFGLALGGHPDVKGLVIVNER